jgi:hypothetical protein
MQPIVFSDVRISYSDFLAYNQQRILRKQWLRVILLPALLWVVLWSGVTVNKQSISVSTKILLGTTSFLLLMLITFIRFRAKAKREYESNKVLQTAATYTLTQDTITVQSPLWQSTTSWETLLGYQKKGDWYYLIAKSAGGLMLDLRCLVPPASAADVDHLLQERGLRPL